MAAARLARRALSPPAAAPPAARPPAADVDSLGEASSICAGCRRTGRSRGLALGGMTPHEVLRCATLCGARYLGDDRPGPLSVDSRGGQRFATAGPRGHHPALSPAANHPTARARTRYQAVAQSPEPRCRYSLGHRTMRRPKDSARGPDGSGVANSPFRGCVLPCQALPPVAQNPSWPVPSDRLFTRSSPCSDGACSSGGGGS